jgi:urea transport system permease protein
MRIIFQIAVAAFLSLAVSFSAHAAELRDLVNGLGEGGYKETEAQIAAIAANADPAAAPVLEAFEAGDVYVRKSTAWFSSLRRSDEPSS